MLEGRAKVWDAVDLEYALAYFKVDQRGFDKKIKDASFAPIPAKSLYEEKPMKRLLCLALHMMNVLRWLPN